MRNIVIVGCIGVMTLSSWVVKKPESKCKSNMCIVMGYHRLGYCK